MINFPITCIDGFFKYPDVIVEMLEDLDYYKSDTGNFPGVRTKPLHISNLHFTKPFIEKVLSTYYNLNIDYIRWESLDIRGNKTPSFVEDKDDIRNRSWIHCDEQGDSNAFAGVIYLNKNVKYHDSGISFFQPITPIPQKDIDDAAALKLKYYKKEDIDINEYCTHKNTYEKKFIKSASFANFYNRLIIFPIDMWHRIDNFSVGTGEDRFTISFWMGPVYGSMFPLERIFKCEL